MGVNYTAVVLASVAQFVIGAIWYMPLFGNLWGRIHGFDKLSKAEKQVAQKSMMPLLVVQFIGTLVTTVILARLFVLVPQYSVYTLGMMIWLGFFVPVQVSAVIFGGTESKWIVQKILVMAGASLACLMAAAAIIGVL